MLFKKKYTEEELVEGCKKNSRKLQEALYLKYFDSMYRMCVRYADGNEDLAIDLVNNGFVKVFTKINTYEGLGSLEGWIRRCVYHCLCDYFRARNRDIHFIEMTERLKPVKSDSALPRLYSEDILKLVDELPETTRNAFILFALEGYSHREVAEALGTTEGTSKWHVSNARKMLKEKLKVKKHG